MPTATPKPPAHVQKAHYVVAVAGNPNCGKTTLFNALTGLRQKVGNYPGVTVEKREGTLTGDASIRLLDLPGTYSLSARSLDEQIARDVLFGRLADTPMPDAVLIVVDSTNLERNLYLASQVIELGIPAVVACNMMDLFRQAGHRLNIEKLASSLGVPVIATTAHRGEGLNELRAALRTVCMVRKSTHKRQWKLLPELEREVASVATAVWASGMAEESAAEGTAIILLGDGPPGNKGHLPGPVTSALCTSFERLEKNGSNEIGVNLAVARYSWLEQVVLESLQRGEQRAASTSDRLDHILTHKIWGTLAFAAMMGALFYSIFIVADPLMGWIEQGVIWLQEITSRAMPAGPLSDLVCNGIIAGVGNVLVFFPQICILFLFIALLEDTGYMARAAFLMDRIMSRVGLHGKSFIPLLSSHACAIPGIMATRTIESPKDRLATILVAPLMSCSARLPVYAILIAACIPGSSWTKAGIMLSMYGLGIVAALAMAALFKKTLLRGPTPAFILELPPYRVPQPLSVLRVMWDRSKLFLTRAGTTILAITIILWVMMNYPKSAASATRFETMRQQIVAENKADAKEKLETVDQQEAAETLQQSIAGRLGRMIEPVIRPLGYDWKIGIGLIASFAAREVFVGTMGIVYSVGEADEESSPLREQMANQKWPDGRKVYTPLVAISLMVFYVLACQCASTIAVVKRETNGWRWPLFMFGYMTVLAYIGALLVYQVGSALSLGTN